MTAKRFTLYEHKDNDYILDNPNVHLDFIEMLGDALTSEEIVDLLNALHEENEQLKQREQTLLNEIKDFQELLTTQEETFLKPIYTALDDAIQNERTALGKSALKQFKQTIME